MRLSLVVVLSACLWRVKCAVDPLMSLKAVARSNWEFSSVLYSAMSDPAKPSENLLFSPLSADLVLAMCYMGAEGTTAKQIAKVLRLPETADLVTHGFSVLLRSLLTSEEVILEVANAIFPATRFPIREDFNEIAREFFLTQIQQIDFTNPSTAAEAINKWVSSTTHKRITNFVSRDGLSPDTAMLLVNVVYFKSVWETPFDKNLTAEAMFNVNGVNAVPVNMMHCKMDARYEDHEDIGARVLELPYKNKDMSLVVVLPKAVEGLASVETKLREEDLKQVLTPRKMVNVEVALPRFSLKSSTDLSNVLKGLGIRDMFASTASFPGMSAEAPGLSVTAVKHATQLEVSEEGTTAVAVTAAEFRPKKFVDVERFIVDRPFLFAVVSRRAGVVIFMGRFVAPPQENTASLMSQEVKLESSERASSAERASSWFWGTIALQLIFIVAKVST